jgi:AraC-like DNA-binding protein
VDSQNVATGQRLAVLNAELSKHCSDLAAAGRKLLVLQERALEICQDLHRELAESRRTMSTIVRVARESTAGALQAVERPAATLAPRRSAPAQHGLPPVRLRRVMDYIDASLDAPLTVTALAGVAGMSPSHFAVLFKRSTGVSPHEAVLRRRVVKAKKLLCEDVQTIAAIGCQVGFSSQAHFTTAFRKRIGVTPRAYRLGRAGLYRTGDRPKISTNPATRPAESESLRPLDAS